MIGHGEIYGTPFFVRLTVPHLKQNFGTLAFDLPPPRAEDIHVEMASLPKKGMLSIITLSLRLQPQLYKPRTTSGLGLPLKLDVAFLCDRRLLDGDHLPLHLGELSCGLLIAADKECRGP